MMKTLLLILSPLFLEVIDSLLQQKKGGSLAQESSQHGFHVYGVYAIFLGQNYFYRVGSKLRKGLIMQSTSWVKFI